MTLNLELHWWKTWKDYVTLAHHAPYLESKGLYCRAAMTAQMNYLCYLALYWAKEPK